MKLNNKIYLGYTLLNGGSTCGDSTEVSDAPKYINKDGTMMRLVFEDHFDGGDIDHNYWREDYMPSRVQTSYNAYSDIRVEDSLLKLRCKATMGCRDGTENGNTIAVSSIQSAVWNGMHLPNPTFHDFRPWYGMIVQEGYMEMRAKLVKGSGTHCAWWLVGTENTEHETCEFDVMENYGNSISTNWFNVYPNGDASSAHVRKSWDVGVDMSDDFHVWGFWWKNGQYKIFFDGVLLGSVNANTPNYPLMTFISVYRRQSGTGVSGDADPTLPDTEMQVDYLRIYKEATSISQKQPTITSVSSMSVNVGKTTYKVSENTGMVKGMPLYCYVNWSDGSRTEHWVKWDRFDASKKSILDVGGTVEWEGIVYGIGNRVICNVTSE